ncbi:hypothetical protein [Sulfuracidifex tepidarius]|uniref:hypothetical protein n=1 Tax=Sulfuracidifex tepidarius TaxID=1294262 RepID=UPI0015680066|nr:hypothetical protein [Sulfuracidifex tepidarius]
MVEMTEQTTSTLQQYLEKAYALAYKAQRLISVDRAAYRIFKEIKELIGSLEEYIINNIEYDSVEVGNKLKYYEKQLALIEEKKDSLLLRFFRQMSEHPSLPQNLDEEKYIINWMASKGYEFCSYDKQEALQKLDEVKEGGVIEEEDPLTGLDIWCLKVRK